MHPAPDVARQALDRVPDGVVLAAMADASTQVPLGMPEVLAWVTAGFTVAPGCSTSCRACAPQSARGTRRGALRRRELRALPAAAPGRRGGGGAPADAGRARRARPRRPHRGDQRPAAARRHRLPLPAGEAGSPARSTARARADARCSSARGADWALELEPPRPPRSPPAPTSASSASSTSCRAACARAST